MIARMKFGVRRSIRGFLGLVKYGGLIGVHGSASVSIEGTFEFGKGVSIARQSVIRVPRDSALLLGDGVSIGREAEVSPEGEIVIGDFTSVQDRCIFLGQLSIGAHCLFAPNVMMSSGTHHFSERPAWLIRDQDALLKDPGYQPAGGRHLPIRVEDDCWIGINSVIMRGVTIGRGSIVGANSVVTQSIAPYSVVAGSPAQLIRRRLEFRPPRSISASNPDHLPYFYAGFDLRQRSIAASPGGLRTKGRFRVALDFAGAESICIELEADRQTILKCGDQELALSAGAQRASLKVNSAPQDGLISLATSDTAGRPVALTVRRISVEP